MPSPEQPAASGEPPSVRHAPPRAAVLMFFLSGVAALIYQVVWIKEMAQVFGVTLYASSAVVASFMAGLALGSLLFGRMADRWREPLALFALIQVGIGAFGLAFPFVLALVKQVYVAAYGPLGDSHFAMSLVRLAMIFPVLLVPTALMGGTLPVFVRAVARRRDRLSSDVAGLYSANNAGAFVGCLAAGYFLLERLGLDGGLRLAVGLNGVVVLMALMLMRRRAGEPAALSEPAALPAAGRPARLDGPVRVALWVFGLEGFTSLVYQMAWLRMLIFFVRADVFGVTAIVGTYLLGLSLGAWLSRLWVDRLRSPLRALGAIEAAIGLTALGTLAALPLLMGVHRYVRQLVAHLPGELWSSLTYSGANFAVTALAILAPTVFMGATLPVVSRIYAAGRPELGRRMGVLGCLDTVGSVFGALAGGFLLVPLVGIQRTIIVTAMMNLALACWAFAACPASQKGRRAAVRVSALALACTGLLLVLRPQPLVRYAPVLRQLISQEIVEYHEDLVATISVVGADSSRVRYLVVDHYVTGDTSPQDRPSHELVMHIPLLIHPAPRRALQVGLGMGLGVGACLAHDVPVDVVELSASMVRVHSRFRDCFELYRRRYGDRSILSDRRVRLRIEDGRNYVLATPERYDVIQVGVFHPNLTAGAAGFYSVDFYEDCRRILTDDGIFTQWLPIHGVPHEDIKTILRTFLTAFSHGTVWHKQSAGYCMLLGTKVPLRIDYQRVAEREQAPIVREYLARCEVRDAVDLLDSFCLGPEAVRRAVGGGPLQTDRHPLLEYHVWRFGRGDRDAGLGMLVRHRERVWPYLVNVPAGQREELKGRMEETFLATQDMLQTKYRLKPAGGQ